MVSSPCTLPAARTVRSLVRGSFGFLLCLGAVSACAPTNLETGEGESAIYYGEASTTDESGVLSLRAVFRQTDDPDFSKPQAQLLTLAYCTAVLIAPNVALTARHCVAYVHPSTDGGLHCLPEGVLEEGTDGGRYPRLANVKLDFSVTQEEIRVAACPEGFDRCPVERTRRVVDIAVPPSTAGDIPSVCRDDLAILRLESAFAPDQATPKPVRLDPSLTAGDPLTAVGYGLTESSEKSGSRKRKAVKVFAVGPADIAASYPSPVRTFSNRGPAQCSGDSGGPTLTPRGAVAGILSRATGGNCALETTQYMSTHLARHRSLLQDTANAWGFELNVERMSGGETCTENEFCASGRCNAGKCATYCDAKQPCASGFRCDVSACVVAPAGPPPAEPPPNASGDSCSVRSVGYAGADGTSALGAVVGAAAFACAFARRRRRELRKRGQRPGKRRVERAMRGMGLTPPTPRRHRTTTKRDPAHPVAPNELNRDFTASRPNERWVTDISYVWTDEGWAYVAVILDLFSRAVVGWAVDATLATSLPLAALNSALRRRCPDTGLMHHSDQGCQYTSATYRKVLAARSITVSMSRRGQCWDNAVAESFFATLKKELVHRRPWANRNELRNSLFEYIEVFYNRRRLHSSLAYKTPAEVEQEYLGAA